MDVLRINNIMLVVQITYLKTPRQEFVLNLKEVALADVHLEGLVDDGEAQVILYVLPSSVTVSHDASQQPVVVPPTDKNQSLNKNQSLDKGYGTSLYATQNV